MRVFISWSGEKSRQIAQIIAEWLPRVLQAAKPYFSPQIPKGKRWLSDLSDVLEASKVGLIVLTTDNLESPWIHFEAGALSKQFEESRVCPVLFGVRLHDLRGPLSQFQIAGFTKEEFRKVLGSINSALESNALNDSVLDDVFEKWWPDLQEQVEMIIGRAISPESEPKTDRSDLLNEIQYIRRQNELLVSTVAELREVIFESMPPKTTGEAEQLTGTWIDETFGGEVKYAQIFGKHLVVAYQGMWPGVFYGTVKDKVFRFSWTRFDGTLCGKGYLHVKLAERMEGGIWFDDTEVDTVLVREDSPIERHVLVRRSPEIEHNGTSLIRKASEFLLSEGLMKIAQQEDSADEGKARR